MFDSQVLSKSLYTAVDVRELDRYAIEECGIPGTLLMKRAGKAAFDTLLEQWPEPDAIHVFCGGGNNGGDGYIVAALAAQRRLPVTVWQLAETLTGAAQAAYEYAVQEGVDIRPFTTDAWQSALEGGDASGVIVDALLGTGTTGPLREPYSTAVSIINQTAWPVLSIDIPSGVNANTGTVDAVAVKATATISFIGQKLGNLIGDGRVCSGQRRVFNDLNVPVETYRDSKIEPKAQVLELSALLDKLPERSIDAHKGDFGHVLVIGGDCGYGGAPLMAAQMAARSGAGLIGVATQPINTAAIIARQPEIMAIGTASGQELLPYLEKPTVLVIGPGLGQSAWSEQLLYYCMYVYLNESKHSNKPMVLDADALNLLSQGRIQWPRSADKPQSWILTPHPGEAARLLDISIAEVQNDRIAAVKALQQKYGGAVILKGAGSLVLTSDQRLFVCDAGNPGMASGGMGDVLSGLLGSLLGQGLSIDDAACLGVILHATAADLAIAESGMRGLLATDLIAYVRLLLDNG